MDEIIYVIFKVQFDFALEMWFSIDCLFFFFLAIVMLFEFLLKCLTGRVIFSTGMMKDWI